LSQKNRHTRAKTSEDFDSVPISYDLNHKTNSDDFTVNIRHPFKDTISLKSPSLKKLADTWAKEKKLAEKKIAEAKQELEKAKAECSYQESSNKIFIPGEPNSEWDEYLRKSQKTYDVRVADLTEKESTYNVQLQKEFNELEKRIITCVEAFKEKATAIESLKKYGYTRSADRREYKAPFFAPPCLRGISKAEKLAALEKVIAWLEVSKIQKPAPVLELTSADIRALTDGDLGKKIKNIEKSDDEFKAAFATAIQNSAQPPKLR
jgi:hypothetical protein